MCKSYNGYDLSERELSSLQAPRLEIQQRGVMTERGEEVKRRVFKLTIQSDSSLLGLSVKVMVEFGQVKSW